jgi:hypothetical protein
VGAEDSPAASDALEITIDQPIAEAPTSIAQAVTREHATSAVHILGVCQVAQLDDEGYGQDELYPVTYVWQYFNSNFHKQIDEQAPSVHVIQPPQHGKLMVLNSDREWTDDADGDWKNPTYFPERGYFGNDSLVLRVEGTDYSIDLHYFLRVAGGDGNTIFDNSNCKTYTWVIS